MEIDLNNNMFAQKYELQLLNEAIKFYKLFALFTHFFNYIFLLMNKNLK